MVQVMIAHLGAGHTFLIYSKLLVNLIKGCDMQEKQV